MGVNMGIITIKKTFFYQLCLIFVLGAGNIFCSLKSVESAEDFPDQLRQVINITFNEGDLEAKDMINIRATCKGFYNSEPLPLLQAYNLAREELSKIRENSIQQLRTSLDENNRKKLEAQKWKVLASKDMGKRIWCSAGLLGAIVTPIIVHVLFKSKIIALLKRDALKKGIAQTDPKLFEQQIQRDYLEFNLAMGAGGALIGTLIGCVLSCWILKKNQIVL